jgi:CBS domain containing-hemolysin-like protein
MINLTNHNNNLKALYSSAVQFLKGTIDNVRLSAAEKLTILLSAVAFYAIVIVVALVALVFISIGIGHLLATTIAPQLAYIYIALFYIILLVVLFAFRKTIFLDPISRFVTRLLVKPPKTDAEDEDEQ